MILAVVGYIVKCYDPPMPKELAVVAVSAFLVFTAAVGVFILYVFAVATLIARMMP